MRRRYDINPMGVKVFCSDDEILLYSKSFSRSFNFNTKKTTTRALINRNNSINQIIGEYVAVPYCSKHLTKNCVLTHKNTRVFGRCNQGYTFTVYFDQHKDTKIEWVE